MNWLKTFWYRLFHKERRAPQASFRIPVDDRALEVYVWILENPTRKHIVATRLVKTRQFFEALKAKGLDIEVYSAARIATGVMWTAPNMALSCTFFVGDPAVYAQLRNRLRGRAPLYNVEARLARA